MTANVNRQSKELGACISFADFQKVDVRVGTIVEANIFDEAKKPAYKLLIDLGQELGLKQSSAQITTHYKPQDLIGRQVLCVVNFPAKQIGPYMSEVLTLGVPDSYGHVVLVFPEKAVPNGAKLF